VKLRFDLRRCAGWVPAAGAASLPVARACVGALPAGAEAAAAGVASRWAGICPAWSGAAMLPASVEAMAIAGTAIKGDAAPAPGAAGFT